jgi:SAM-dependent methyltransferase
MNKIVKYLESKNIRLNDSTFIDLGCGNGKTLAYATVHGFKQARGAEIVEARYEYAERKRAQLQKKMRDKITIKKSDIFELPKRYFPSNSVVFVSNLLFPEKTNQELIKYLSENTQADTIIIISKVPPNLYKLKLIEKIHVPMSWAINSECYVLGHK